MEKTMSVEDKIRRAEEIYNRRRKNQIYNTAKVNVNDKKDFKLFKKMILQIVVCLAIYCSFYFLVNNNYIFSEDLRTKTKEILSYDIDFTKVYENISNTYNSYFNINQNLDSKDILNQEEVKSEEIKENAKLEDNKEDISNNTEENIGGAVEEDTQSKEEEKKQEQKVNISQEEKDIIDIKNSLSFIVPVQGYISSKFGIRNPTTDTVPKNHTGLDIAAVSGTIIKSATDGVVSLASSQGDYGNHLKITNGDVTIVYAHCKTLYVKEGDKVKQGQNIAEVGSTGNSTGPHLHFEIRKQDRFVDPQRIIEI